MSPKDFVCSMCPNGCHLTTAVLADGSIQIQGNRCEKGLAFAKRVLETRPEFSTARIVAGQKKPVYSREALTDIAAFWGVGVVKVFPDLMPDGSPERTIFRVVIEDDRKKAFVLEQIPPAAYHTKLKIIQTLEFLAKKDMPRILLYLADSEGRYIQEHRQGLWQLVPFVRGVTLDREKYLYEGWRAQALSRFLIELREKARDMSIFETEKIFSIKEYIAKLLRQIEKRQPQTMARLAKVIDFLDHDFMPVHDQLPVSFCHGDYHPLNIIWSKDGILAVIDWEFLGIKPEIYDAANMVGCLGMEHPSSLMDDLVIGFIKQLKASGIFSPASWNVFLEFVVALRFAWLSEWLRKEDAEMISLELDYLDLLIENQSKLKQAWEI